MLVLPLQFCHFVASIVAPCWVIGETWLTCAEKAVSEDVVVTDFDLELNGTEQNGGCECQNCLSIF